MEDILVQLNKIVPWEEFRPLFEEIQYKRISNAGRKAYDVVLMFKILILQSLYNLSDEIVEMQILNRLSFMRFLGIGIGDDVPDSNTIWTFREKIKEKELTKKLFNKFDMYFNISWF
ncbi:MAG: transposase [Desulfobacteraceae bacterium]|nr:transposase [Desulfobacteraceae bacterium]